MSENAIGKLRVDKWLFYARLFKTRTIASAAVAQGQFRINSQLVKKPSYMIKIGDVLTFPKSDYIRVIEIKLLAKNRGPATVAVTLYDDLDPPQPKRRDNKLLTAEREKGSGRPTKRERRDTDKLRDFI